MTTALLLDTHALLWFATGDSARMPDTVRQRISDPARDVFVSAASFWEIATKARLGKLGGVDQIVARPMLVLAELGMTALPVAVDHATRAGSFDVDHRDPFDRMLAAQSLILDVPIVSVDPALDLFGVSRIWA